MRKFVRSFNFSHAWAVASVVSSEHQNPGFRGAGCETSVSRPHQDTLILAAQPEAKKGLDAGATCESVSVHLKSLHPQSP